MMKKFTIAVLLIICTENLLTNAVPAFTNGNTQTLEISMFDSTACGSGLSIVSAVGTSPVTYATDNPYGFTVDFDSVSTYEYQLYCDFSVLQGLDSSQNNLQVVVDATDTDGVSSKTYTIKLLDRFAPEFTQNPITIAVSLCDLDTDTYTDGQVIYTVGVTDADPDDAVTVEITSSGTPFAIQNHNEVVLASVATLLQLLNTSSTSNPYIVDIRARDNGNKHSTDGQVQISYNRDEICNNIDSGNDNGNGDVGGNEDNDDDDDGVSIITYNMYLLCFLIVIILVIQRQD